MLMFQCIQRLRFNSDLVSQTHENMRVIDNVELSITSADSSFRNHAVTGKNEDLESFYAETAHINQLLSELEHRTEKLDHRSQGTATLRNLVEQKVDAIRRKVTQSSDSVPVAAEDAKPDDVEGPTFDEMRTELDSIRKWQDSVLGERTGALDQAYFLALLTAMISTTAGLGLVAVVFWTTQDSRKKLDAATAVLFFEREQLQVTLASIGDGVIVCDHDCQVTFLNPVSERLTGWTESEARGQAVSKVFNIVSDETRVAVENPAARAIREGGTVGHANHTLLISRSGSEISIDDSASPIRDAQHNITGAVLVFRDVTDRRNEENRLHEAAEFTRSIVDSLGELVLVLDEQLRVLHVNRAFSTAFQITDDRVLGRSIYEIDDGQLNLPTVHELLEGTPEKIDNVAYIEIEQKSRHMGRKCLRLTAKKFAAGSHRKEALLLVISDFTEERVLEETNRRQDQHMRWFLDQIKDYAIFTMDVACRATSWNKGVKQVLGYDEEEFIGHNVSTLIFTPEAQAGGIPEAEFSLAALDQRASDDRWMMRKGGIEFWASGITTSIRDEKGHLIGYCKVMRDLTSAKKSQDELSKLATRLAEMDRRKNEFLATLAHELRNPLAPIKNAVQLMGMLKIDPEIDELRQMMARQVEQLVRLIDDLLDVSRIARGKISLRSEIVDLRAIIDAAVEASSAFIAENGQELVVNVPAGEAFCVYGDPSRLTQVVSNLLNNSAKYSEAGSRIELGVVLERPMIAIRVTDNGSGIATELLQSIFGMFSQAEDTVERGSAGLGIGLTLVKTLVELHEGTVIAESDGLGKGSTFTVRLPAVAEVASSKGALAVNTQAALARSFKVLVVEDMRALRVITARLLEKLGHEVEFAENGPLALGKLETFTPDVVFSDIAMPGMTGYELAQRIRQRHGCSQVFLVALTGFGQASDRDKALDAGFQEHMVKPVDIEVLKAFFDGLAERIPRRSDV